MLINYKAAGSTSVEAIVASDSAAASVQIHSSYTSTSSPSDRHSRQPGGHFTDLSFSSRACFLLQHSAVNYFQVDSPWHVFQFQGGPHRLPSTRQFQVIPPLLDKALQQRNRPRCLEASRKVSCYSSVFLKILY